MTPVRAFTRTTLLSLLAACPPAAFAAAGLPSPCWRFLRPAPPTLAELAALLGDVPGPALPALAQQIATREIRNRLVELLVDGPGVHTLVPHVRALGFERLRALRARGLPALLVTWHAGPYLAVGAALQSCGLEFLALRHRARGPDGNGVETVATGGGSWEAAAALKRALARLRQGGVVVMAGDGLRGEGGAEVEVLGRRVVFQRGFAVLAHHASAPVFPVVSRWRGRHIDVHLHEPLGVVASDQDDLLRTAARWLDGHLRSAPEELRPDRIRLLLSAPRVDGREARA